MSNMAYIEWFGYIKNIKDVEEIAIKKLYVPVRGKISVPFKWAEIYVCILMQMEGEVVGGM
jgi:hypothetical protein